MWLLYRRCKLYLLADLRAVACLSSLLRDGNLDHTALTVALEGRFCGLLYLERLISGLALDSLHLSTIDFSQRLALKVMTCVA